MENLEVSTDQLSTELVQHWKEELEHLNKKELLSKIQHWKLEDDYSESSQFLKLIRQAFDQISEQERTLALQNFIDNGEDSKDFQFKKDETALAFETAFENLKVRLSDHYKEQESSRAKNLKTKNTLLDALRNLVASEDGPSTLEAFKKIQNDWKATGPVPSASAKELNANYHGLLEIFYNNRAIYFELKDLDRKKNSQLKTEVCEKIEALLGHKDAMKALIELRKFQDEYREIGMALKEESDAIHARYREAIDKLMQKKDAFIAEMKVKRDENLVLKKELLTKLEAYRTFTTSKIDTWKEKTLEVLSLQEEWKKIGGAAQEVNKELNNEFWAISKAFYHGKHEFFKVLDEKRKENLQLKNALSEKAEALKESADFASASKELIRLQADWAKIGQVPIKFKDSSYKRFKAACDHFFTRQRDSAAAAEQHLLDNVAKKTEQCNAILEANDLTVENLEAKFNHWIKEWSAIGEVPRHKMADVQLELSSTLSKAIAKLSDLSGQMKEDWLLKVEVLQAKAGGDAKAKLEKIEKDILRKTKELKAEAEQYKTNMDFWAKSKNADQIKADIQSKIVEAEEEIIKLAKKLKILRD